MSPDVTPLQSLSGGALIGAAASAMLLLEGRVAGISGIVGGLFSPRAGDIGWRVAFLAGMLSAGLVVTLAAPSALAVHVERPTWALVLAGLLVGVGTRVGNGCTSGHGVCGLSRMSPRSAASVATFMTVGALVASITSRLLGGAL
jgi:uncharacterized membrane protein YedE/YeeE